MPKNNKPEQKTEAQKIYDEVNEGGTVAVVADKYNMPPEEVLAIVDEINQARAGK